MIWRSSFLFSLSFFSYISCLSVAKLCCFMEITFLFRKIFVK